LLGHFGFIWLPSGRICGHLGRFGPWKGKKKTSQGIPRQRRVFVYRKWVLIVYFRLLLLYFLRVLSENIRVEFSCHVARRPLIFSGFFHINFNVYIETAQDLSRRTSGLIASNISKQNGTFEYVLLRVLPHLVRAKSTTRIVSVFHIPHLLLVQLLINTQHKDRAYPPLLF
jgi:hypothetical protein